jgi:large subunit ribosomal protein L18
MANQNITTGRLIRQRRVRAKIKGTTSRPRLGVFRSNRRIYAFLINDEMGKMISQVSVTDVKSDSKDPFNKVRQATETGQAIAVLALAQGIKEVVFDRSGYRYAGRVKALAEGARQGGLIF